MTTPILKTIEVVKENSPEKTKEAVKALQTAQLEQLMDEMEQREAVQSPESLTEKQKEELRKAIRESIAERLKAAGQNIEIGIQLSGLNDRLEKLEKAAAEKSPSLYVRAEAAVGGMLDRFRKSDMGKGITSFFGDVLPKSAKQAWEWVTKNVKWLFFTVLSAPQDWGLKNVPFISNVSEWAKKNLEFETYASAVSKGIFDAVRDLSKTPGLTLSYAEGSFTETEFNLLYDRLKQYATGDTDMERVAQTYTAQFIRGKVKAAQDEGKKAFTVNVTSEELINAQLAPSVRIPPPITPPPAPTPAPKPPPPEAPKK